MGNLHWDTLDHSIPTYAYYSLATVEFQTSTMLAVKWETIENAKKEYHNYYYLIDTKKYYESVTHGTSVTHKWYPWPFNKCIYYLVIPVLQTKFSSTVLKITLRLGHSSINKMFHSSGPSHLEADRYFLCYRKQTTDNSFYIMPMI